MATLRDVAQRAGVSIGTVRRVLYDLTPVRPETSARVNEALAELGYVPNLYARALVGGTTSVIAIVVPPLLWYVGSVLVLTLQRRLAALGRHGVFFVNEHGADEETLAEISRLSPQALLLVQVNWQEGYRRFIEAGVPLLGIDVQPEIPPDVPADAIGIDRAAGFYAATEHLLHLGHRCIGLLNYYAGRGRVEGYTQALAAAGVDYRALASGDSEGRHAPTIRTCLAGLLAAHPDLTALVCTTDLWTQQVIHHLPAMGRRVPEDLSLTSYSNEPWTQWVRPALTTLEQGTTELCEHTLALMQRRLEGSTEPWSRRVLCPKLVVRETTAPPRARWR